MRVVQGSTVAAVPILILLSRMVVLMQQAMVSNNDSMPSPSWPMCCQDLITTHEVSSIKSHIDTSVSSHAPSVLAGPCLEFICSHAIASKNHWETQGS
jgi:hypothetical protein